MVKKVSVAQAKSDLSNLLRFVEEGNQAVIERHGRPVVTLRAWTENDEANNTHWSERLLGAAAGIEDFEPIMQSIAAERSMDKGRDLPDFD